MAQKDVNICINEMFTKCYARCRQTNSVVKWSMCNSKCRKKAVEKCEIAYLLSLVKKTTSDTKQK